MANLETVIIPTASTVPVGDWRIQKARDAVVGETEWKEVPKEQFDKWDQATQFRYCAARDLAAARLEAKNGDEDAAGWYRRRAAGYVRSADELVLDDLPL